MNTPNNSLLPFSIAEINEAVGLSHFDNDISVYMDILEVYYSSGDETLTFMDEAFENGNYKDYGIYVHALKSTSSTVGAVILSEHAEKHEIAAKAGNISYIRDDYDSLKQEYVTLLDKLKPVFE